MKGWPLLLTAGICSCVWSAAAPATCDGDFNGDGVVTIEEIVTTVNNALNGCAAPEPSATATVPVTPVPTASVTRTPTRTRTPTPTPRFADNGDGTITDHQTNLMWEKKSDDGSIHDQESLFTWTATYPASPPDGTVFTTFVNTLDLSGFAGHNDWRLPSLDELLTIVDTAGHPQGQPLVPAAFNTNCTPGCTVRTCSCTKALNYWTVTVNTANTTQAWYVLFNSGGTGVSLKTQPLYARAVRTVP